MGGYSAFEDFVEDLGLVALQAYGEGFCLADLVFHGAEGFVEGVDYEVAGSGAEGVAGGGVVLFEGEADCSGDGGGEGDGLIGQAYVEDEFSAPVWVEVVEEGEGSEGAELEGVGGGGASGGIGF